jgi:hypothetical protein
MMKKMKSAAIVLAAAAGLSSCTIIHTAVVTNNPVGSKKGEVKTSIGTSQGVSFHEAMKNGRITKIGIAEFKAKIIVIIPSQRLTITGE